MLKKLYDEDDIRIAVTIESFYNSPLQGPFGDFGKYVETYDDLISLMEKIHKAYIEEYDTLGFAEQGYVQEFAYRYLEKGRYRDIEV